MFVTAKDPIPSDTNNDSGNDLLSLAKLMKKYQLSSKQLIQLIENNQLKPEGNMGNSSRISLASRNHCY